MDYKLRNKNGSYDKCSSENFIFPPTGLSLS